MHPIQEKILKLGRQMDLSKIGLRQLGKLVGVEHAQQVKHHLEQLEKRGLIYRDKKTGTIKLEQGGESVGIKLFSLPIVGSANCGEARELAQEQIKGYLRVSAGSLGRKDIAGLFVIEAIGDSLNQAKGLDGTTIENGDFVIIDGVNRNPQNGDYVLSIIDDAANLKRFYRDGLTGQIALVSESTINIPPIYIHPDDYSEYMVNGVVVKVFKKPK